MKLHDIRTLLIDGDGVLWHSSTSVPGFSRFFGALKERNIRWALVTNNSTATIDSVMAKMIGFGAEVEPHQVVSSATATASAMRERFPPGTPFYVIGEEGIQAALRESGFLVHTGEVMPPVPVPAVIVGMDRHLTYGRLTVATRLIRAGAAFIATNPDRTFPAVDGINPGTGAQLWALEAATYQKPFVIGKPETPIFEAALRQLGATAEGAAMLGDRLDTDIQGAINAGIGAILVLSGVDDEASLAASSLKPDWVFSDIGALASALLGEAL